METSYFLGANTASGFLSLYDGFCRGKDDYLHIIKGGPGTGKSGFMRAIGREAARRGLDVEYVRCSDDPASLEGVYLPELHTGWCDGTAPHAAEPGIFGAGRDYVNLGAFCRTPLSSADADCAALSPPHIRNNTRAYALLAAAKSAESALAPQELGEKEALREGARYLRAGCETLHEAKALHDELEAVYRPYMDFAALDALTAKELARIFS